MGLIVQPDPPKPSRAQPIRPWAPPGRVDEVARAPRGRAMPSPSSTRIGFLLDPTGSNKGDVLLQIGLLGAHALGLR